MNTNKFLYKSSSDSGNEWGSVSSDSENEWGNVSSDTESEKESIQSQNESEHESKDDIKIDYIDTIKNTIYKQHVSSTTGQIDEFSALERSSLIIHELLQFCPTKDINTIKLMKLEDKEQIACLIHSYAMELQQIDYLKDSILVGDNDTYYNIEQFRILYDHLSILDQKTDIINKNPLGIIFGWFLNYNNPPYPYINENNQFTNEDLLNKFIKVINEQYSNKFNVFDLIRYCELMKNTMFKI